MRELGMFFFFLAVAMVIFSSAVYYAEAGLEKTQV
jgi:potassium voltage-gated channel Shaker-related subfamily A protein